MKRRSFLSLFELSAAPVPTAAEAEEEKAPAEVWWGTVSSEALKFRAVSVEEKLVLHVELLKPAEGEVPEVKDERGGFRCYRNKGKDLAYLRHPSSNLPTECG